MNSSTNLSLTEIKQRLAPFFHEPELQIVLLFGSRVSGRVHPGSDIDLGVLFDSPVNLVEITNRITGLLHTDIVIWLTLEEQAPFWPSRPHARAFSSMKDLRVYSTSFTP